MLVNGSLWKTQQYWGGGSFLIDSKKNSNSFFMHTLMFFQFFNSLCSPPPHTHTHRDTYTPPAYPCYVEMRSTEDSRSGLHTLRSSPCEPGGSPCISNFFSPLHFYFYSDAHDVQGNQSFSCGPAEQQRGQGRCRRRKLTFDSLHDAATWLCSRKWCKSKRTSGRINDVST